MQTRFYFILSKMLLLLIWCFNWPLSVSCCCTKGKENNFPPLPSGQFNTLLEKRGCLDETPCPDVFPVPAPALIIPRLFLWESDAALAEHKEVREHPWTLSTRAQWYSNNMHTIWLRSAKRVFWILHLHVTLCPLFSLKFKELSP